MDDFAVCTQNISGTTRENGWALEARPPIFAVFSDNLCMHTFAFTNDLWMKSPIC